MGHPGLGDDILERLNSLSPRQKEVMRLVARHYQNKEIARILGISEHTARAHAIAVRTKLGGVSRREAARILSEHADAIGIPPERSYQSSGIADPAQAASSSDHHTSDGYDDDRRPSDPDTQFPDGAGNGDDALDAHRNRPEVSDGAGKGAPDHRDDGSNQEAGYEQPRKDGLHADFGVRLADGRNASPRACRQLRAM